MADYGARYTDRREAVLDKRLHGVYLEAQKDLQRKLADFVAKKEKANEKKLAQLAAGEISEQDYKHWLAGTVFQEKQWKEKVDQATEILLQSNRKAMTLIRGEQLNVFTENANWQAYDAEKATGFDQNYSFTLYDTATVDRLLKKEPELLPRKTVNGKKDKAWNKRIINNVVTQGIIQGESIPKIAKRMAQDTASTNMKAMVRYARTAMTGAQNAGRMETMHRAEDMDIRVKKQWLATLDARTRDSHRHLDGDIKDIDEPFRSDFGKIMFPGDPAAHPGDVYNCRCTLVYVYPDFADEGAMRRNQETGGEIEDISYDEWKAGKDDGSNGVTYTEAEREGVDAYVSSSYSGINTALRNGTVEDYPDVKRIVDAIDRAMEKSTLTEDTICSRGTDFYELSGLWGHRPDWYEEEDHLNSIIGKDAVVKSYTSTTKGEAPLQQYVSKGVEIVYDVDAGVHAIDIEKMSGRNAATVEKELLLDRDIVVRPTRIEYTADEDGFVEGKVRIYVKVIGNNDNSKPNQEIAQTRKSGTHYKEGENKRKIIPQPVYNKITKKAEKEGAVIRRGGEEVLEYLKKRGATASTIGNDILLRDDPTTTEVLEEVYHFRQNKNGVNDDKGLAERYLRNEIEAQKYLISVADRFNIPQEERDETVALLESYERQLKDLEAKK